MSGFLQPAAYQPPHSNVDRTYDYDLKYKADTPGNAAGPDARVWKIYLDEADIVDHDMLQGFRDNIDALLVFAALFSAVVTTFTVETKDFLQPDYAQITAFLLVEQLQLLRTGGNVTAMSYIPPSNIRLETETPSTLNLWMAGLFYTSLSLSLGTALLSILVKQWLTSYSSLTSGDTQLRCLIRQFRFSGLEHWKLSQIIRFLPLLLHFSLAIFLVGFSLFVYSLYPPLSVIIVTITATIFLLYISSAILPVFHRDCPFRIPILQDLVIFYCWVLFHYRLTLKRLWFRILDFFSVYCPYCPHSVIDIVRPCLDPWSPSLSDSQFVQTIEQKHILVTHSFDWLFRQTSNFSVHRITTIAVADLVYQNGWTSDVPSSWLDMVPVACNEFFTQPPGVHTTLLNFLQTTGSGLQTPHDMRIYPANILQDAVEFGKRDLILNFLARGLHPDYVSSPSSKRMLVLAAEKNDVELAQDLLKFGAQCNLDGEVRSPLFISLRKKSRKMTSFLLENGASLRPELIFPDFLEQLVEFRQRDLILGFVARGISPDFVSSPSSKRMLVLATENHNVELVQDLLRVGAKCDVDGEAISPLCVAAERRYEDIASILLDNGALVDTRRYDGMTPLHIASSSATRPVSESFVELLIDHWADPNVQDDDGMIPLHYACLSSHVEVCRMLVSQPNSHVDIKDNKGYTPLLLLVSLPLDKNRAPLTTLLLDNGADLSISNHDGYTPLIVANKWMSPEHRTLMDVIEPYTPKHHPLSIPASPVMTRDENGFGLAPEQPFSERSVGNVQPGSETDSMLFQSSPIVPQ